MVDLTIVLLAIKCRIIKFGVQEENTIIKTLVLITHMEVANGERYDRRKI